MPPGPWQDEHVEIPVIRCGMPGAPEVPGVWHREQVILVRPACEAGNGPVPPVRWHEVQSERPVNVCRMDGPGAGATVWQVVHVTLVRPAWSAGNGRMPVAP